MPTHQFAHPDVLEVSAAAPFRYRVHFGRRLLDPRSPLLAAALTASPEPPPHGCLAFLDAGLVAARPELPAGVESYFSAHADEVRLLLPPLALAGGEPAKNSFDIPRQVIRLARRERLSRHGHILAIGGGAFLDAVGFAAALIHRGVRLVRMPSTVLAQNDAGVGVKNGLNLDGLKNFLGTFAPPAAVLNDFDLLSTLADRDWRAGIAEAFKVAAIRDAAFLDWLIAAAPALRARDEAAMETLVRRCAALHLDQISGAGDPFESGSARPLDFGHWAAHKLESLSGHELNHGEAVAIGMALDLLYAAASGHLGAAEAGRVIRGLRAAGLPVWHAAAALPAPDGRPLLLQGIEEFREHLGGRLHVTLPSPLGRGCEVHDLDEAILRRCLTRLAAMASLEFPL